MDVELNLDVLRVDAGFAMQCAVEQSPVELRLWREGLDAFSEDEFLISLDVGQPSATGLLGFNDCGIAFVLKVNTREQVLCLLGLFRIFLHLYEKF